LICIPPGLELPEGYDIGLPECEEGQFPVELPTEPPENLICLPEGTELPEGLDWGLPTCAPGQFPIELPEPPDRLICIPEDVAAELPEDFPWLEELGVCGPDEFPFDIGDPPEQLVCIPAEVDLPENFPWDLPKCEPGQLPVELPEEPPEALKCIPAGLDLPFELPWDLPTCEEGELPFEMPELPELPELPEGYDIPAFEDVPQGSEVFSAVQLLYNEGYVSGVGNGEFDPGSTLNRDALAVLMARVRYGAQFEPAQVSQPAAADLDINDWANRWIAAVKDSGDMVGDDQGNFNPDDPVQMAHMAVVALRAKYGAGFVPEGGDAGGEWYDKWMDKAHEEGLVPCVGDTCATMPVTRGLAAEIMAQALAGGQ